MFNRKALENSINKLIRKFSRYPNLFLTEADLRCYLVAELLKSPYFLSRQRTKDNSWSIPVHSEVRWYGESGKLKYRSDVVILDPTDLRVKEKFFKLPSKGYGFNKFWIIIELKLRRVTKNKSDNKFLKEIRGEISRLKNIRRDTRNRRARYYLLCFDKRNNIEDRVRGIENDGVAIGYTFSRE